MTCPIVSEHNLGLRPFPTTPQFNKTSMNLRINCFSDLAKHIQFGALKCINGEPKNKREMHLLAKTNHNTTNGSKMCKQRPRAVGFRASRSSSIFIMWGKRMKWRKLHPCPLLSHFHAEGAHLDEPARPGELTLHFFCYNSLQNFDYPSGLHLFYFNS